jgi:hypothetical protein
MPNYDFPEEQTLVRYLAMLREVIVYARAKAYETDSEIACILDEVENVPDLLTRWPDMDEDIVIAGLRQFENKYMAGGHRFSDILIDGPTENWQLRGQAPRKESANLTDDFPEKVVGDEQARPPSPEQLRERPFADKTLLRISCELDYWSDSVATFDPVKVAMHLRTAFPESIVDPQDRSELEVQSLHAFLESRELPTATKETMLRQIKGKQRTNGPVFGFGLSAGLASIRGLISRYRIQFLSDAILEQSLQDRIVGFLNSLKLGTVKISKPRPNRP